MSSDTSTRLPNERLQQIALRKLQSLGVLTRLVPERGALEGDLVFKTGKVLQPGTDQMLQRARFVVHGHDRMAFVDLPLEALGPISFYDVTTPTALEERIAQAIRQRVQQLEPWKMRLERLKLPIRFDVRALSLRSEVRTTSHRFELSVGPEGVRVLRAHGMSGPPLEVSTEFPLLKLEEYPQAVDLEIYLAHELPKIQQAKVPPPVQAPLQRLPPAPGSLSLAKVLEKLGNDVSLAPNAPLELQLELTRGTERLRFTATRQGGASFVGKLQSSAGVLWSETFELDRFPGTEAMVRKAIGATEQAAAAGGAVPTHLEPHPGEVWVMNVLVEAEGADEVRYVCTNTDGAPYGASRVLRRSDFETAFVKSSGGYRLLIRIETSEADAVTYTQLDGQRQPRGQLKRLAKPILVTTFIPEAAAY